MPDVIKALGAMGPTKDNNFMDWSYQPMIKITKSMIANRPDLLKEFPTGEMPNPKYPAPVRTMVPAWLLIVAAVAGVSVWAILTYGVENLVNDIKKSTGKEGGGFLDTLFRTTPIGALGGITGWF